MEERCVSIDGVDHSLDGVFFVAATQNPVEYEGTYPLPEAQLDRFLMKIIVGYPSAEEEIEVLKRAHAGFDPHDLSATGLTPLGSMEPISEAWGEIRAVKVDEGIVGYAAAITRKTREAYQVVLGASPRASIALIKCSKVLAALRGRDYVTPDDVKSLAMPILRHRLILSPESSIEGITPDQIISGVLSAVPVPR
jgi:MoxR-like ATPase